MSLDSKLLPCRGPPVFLGSLTKEANRRQESIPCNPLSSGPLGLNLSHQCTQHVYSQPIYALLWSSSVTAAGPRTVCLSTSSLFSLGGVCHSCNDKSVLSIKIGKHRYTQRMSKRIYAWWDCLYTNKRIQLKKGDWDFSNNKGPSKYHFSDTALEEYRNKSNRSKRVSFWEINFDTCDFVGDFEHGEIKFTGCSFTNCDFGDSRWSKAKFNKCKFLNCSITLAEFSDCFFHECSWKNVTFNGRTRFFSTLVSDACQMVNSGYTNTDTAVLEAKGVTVKHQLWRLEQSKAKISRMLMQGSEHHGDDRAYYSAVKSYLTQTVKASRSKALYDAENERRIYRGKAFSVFANVELSILNISGWMNGWGASIARPAAFGVLLVLIFGAIYAWQSNSIWSGLIKSFDITFLIGYTKHSLLDVSLPQQALYACNAFLGLWWYAILVPCLVNRITRVL